MTTEATRSESPARVHPGLRSPLHSPQPKIHGNESGSFGRRVRPVEVESSLTERDARTRLRNVGASLGRRLGEFFIFPQALVDAPPGRAELTAYAHRGAWTADGRGFVRGLGVLWLYAIALPVVYRARFKEWLLTRPSRAVLFIALALLVLHKTGPGHWAADSIIRPWFHALAWIFLP